MFEINPLILKMFRFGHFNQNLLRLFVILNMFYDNI